MDTMSAFAMGQANRGKEMMVFDWEKAVRIIKERQPQEARAGLSGDWEYTGGTIFEDGKPVPRENTYTYLASTWATPELEIDSRPRARLITHRKRKRPLRRRWTIRGMASTST